MLGISLVMLGIFQTNDIRHLRFRYLRKYEQTDNKRIYNWLKQNGVLSLIIHYYVHSSGISI